MELSPKLLLKIDGMHSKYYNNEIIRKKWWKKWKINAIEEKQANKEIDQQQSQEIINFAKTNNYDEQLMLQKIASSPNPPTNNLINEKQKKCKKTTSGCYLVS